MTRERERGEETFVPGETNRPCHGRPPFPPVLISFVKGIETRKIGKETAFREPGWFDLGILLDMRKEQVDVSLRLSEIIPSH